MAGEGNVSSFEEHSIFGSKRTFVPMFSENIPAPRIPKAHLADI
jgi:hypothetical protein